MADRLHRGRDGTRIRGSGTTARTFRSVWVLELAFSAASDGAGLTGDSIGTTATPYTTAKGITPEVGLFTTEIIFIGVQGREEHTPLGAEYVETLAHAAAFTIGLASRHGHSKGTPERREATLRSVDKAVCGRVRSVAMTMVDRQGALLREVAPALAEDVAVSAGGEVGVDATKSG